MCIHNNTIVIGAYGDSLSGSSTGAVYIFRKVAIEEKEVHTDANEIDEAKNITGGQPWNYEWVEIQKLFPGRTVTYCINLTITSIIFYYLLLRL